MSGMMRGLAAPVLAALGLLAACSEGPASDVAPPPSAAPSGVVAAAAPKPLEAAASTVPTFNAARYPPRDDCAALPGWTEFSAKLRSAAKRHDAETLAALSDPDIKLDFGDGAGVEELRRRLTDRRYNLWDEIDALLPLGCGFKEGSAFLPWVFWNAPEDADPYSAMLVLGKDVPARARPEASAPILGKLDWALVELAQGAEPDAAFARVKLPGGGTGFIEAAKLRSIIDYRLIAERGEHGWQITALIAGD